LSRSIAFNRLRELCAGQKRLRNAAAKLILRWMNMAIVTAFIRWSSWLLEQKQMRHKANRVVARWSRLCLAESFDKWLQTSSALTDSLAKQTKAAQMWKRRGVLLAFMRWRDAAHEQARMERTMERAIGRWTRQALAAAYVQWYDKVKLFSHQRNMLERIILRMVLVEAAATFSRWRAQADLFKHQASRLEKVIFRMQNALVAQAFELWRHQILALCHQRNCMERVILRMRNAKLAAAFDFWHCHALLFARQRTVLEKVIYRMAHRIVAIAFDKLCINVLEMQRRLRTVLKRAVAQWTQKELALALQMWKSEVEQHTRQRAILGKAARRMGNLLLARGFRRWCESASKLRIMRLAASRVVKRWLCRTLSSCMEAWKDKVHALNHQHTILGKAALRMGNLQLAMGFSTWCDGYKTSKSHRIKLHKLLSRWKTRECAKSVSRWRVHTVQHRRLRTVLKRAVAQWTQKELALALQMWKSEVEQHTRQRAILGKAARRMGNLLLARGFRRWCESASKLQIMRLTASRVVKRWLHAVIARSLFLWREQFSEGKRLRLAVSRIVRKLAHFALVACLHNWKFQVETTQRLASTAEKVRMDRVLCVAVGDWKRFVERVVQYKRRQGAVERKHDARRTKLLRKVFNGAWKSFVERVVQYKRREWAVERRHDARRTKLLRKVFNTLQDVPMKIMQTRSLARTILLLSSRTRTLVHFSLRTWYMVCRIHRLRRKSKNNLKHRMNFSLLQTAITHWGRIARYNSMAVPYTGDALQLAYIKLHEAREVWSHATNEMDDLVDTVASIEAQKTRIESKVSKAIMIIVNVRSQDSMRQAWLKWEQCTLPNRINRELGLSCERMVQRWNARRQILVFQQYRHHVQMQGLVKLLEASTYKAQHRKRLSCYFQHWKQLAIQRLASLNFDSFLNAQDHLILKKNTLMRWFLVLSFNGLHRYTKLTAKIIARGRLKRGWKIWFKHKYAVGLMAVLEVRLEHFVTAKRMQSARAVLFEWYHSAKYGSQLLTLQTRINSALESHTHHSRIQDQLLAVRTHELEESSQAYRQEVTKTCETVGRLQRLGMARMSRAREKASMWLAFDVWYNLEKSETSDLTGGALLNITVPEPSICSPALCSGLMATAFAVQLSQEGDEHYSNDVSLIHQLKLDIECTLQAPRGSVQVLYRHMGTSTLELVFSGRDIETGFEYCNDFVGVNPAEELKLKVEDPTSSIHSLLAARLIASVEVHGDVSYRVANEISRGMRAFEELRKNMKEVEQMLHERSRALQTDCDRFGVMIQRANTRNSRQVKTIVILKCLHYARVAFAWFVSSVLRARHVRIVCVRKTVRQNMGLLAASFQRLQNRTRLRRVLINALRLLSTHHLKHLLSRALHVLRRWKRTRQAWQHALMQITLQKAELEKRKYFYGWKRIAKQLSVEANLPVVVAMKFDLDYDDIIADASKRETFHDQLMHDMSVSLGVPAHTFFLLAYHKGSIIVQVAFTPIAKDANDSHRAARAPSQLAHEMLAQVNSDDSIFRRQIVGCSVQSARVQGTVPPEIMPGIIQGQTSVQAQLQQVRSRILEDVLKRNVTELMLRNSCETSMSDSLDGLQHLIAALEHILRILTEADLEGRLEASQSQVGLMKGRVEDLERRVNEATRAGSAASASVNELKDRLQASEVERTRLVALVERSSAEEKEMGVEVVKVRQQGGSDEELASMLTSRESESQSQLQIRSIASLAAINAETTPPGRYETPSEQVARTLTEPMQVSEGHAEVSVLKVKISALSESHSQSNFLRDFSRESTGREDQPQMNYEDQVVILRRQRDSALSKLVKLEAMYEQQAGARTARIAKAVTLTHDSLAESKQNAMEKQAQAAGGKAVQEAQQRQNRSLLAENEELSSKLTSVRSQVKELEVEQEQLQHRNRLLLEENEGLASQMVLARSKIEELEIKYAEHVHALSAGLEDAVSIARARTGEWQENEAVRAAFVAVEAVQGSLKQQEELFLQEQKDKEEALSLELMERIKQADRLLLQEQKEREEALREMLIVRTRQAEAHAAQSNVYVTAVEAVHDTLQREKSVLASEVDALFVEVAMGVRKADDLRSALIEVRVERNQLADELNTMKSEMEQHRSSATRDLILQQARCVAIRATFKTHVTSFCNELIIKTGKFENELSVALIDLEATRFQLAALKKENSAMSMRIAEVHERLIEERDTFREQKGELDRLKENLNIVQVEGQQMREKLSEKESALASEQQRVKDLQTEVNLLQANLNSSQAESRMSLRGQGEALDTLRENLSIVRVEGQQIRERLSEKESALTSEQERVRILQSEVNSLRAILNSSQAESRMSLREQGEELDSLRENLHTMSGLFEQKDLQTNELRQSRSTLQAEIVAIRDKLSTSRQELEKREHDLSIERDANACLQSEMETLRSSHAEVSKYVMQLRSDRAQQQTWARRVELELKALQASSQEELAMLRLDVDTAHMSEADMAVRAAHADAKTIELQRELDSTRRTSQCMQMELSELRARVRQESERTASLHIGLQQHSSHVRSVFVELEMLTLEMTRCEMQLVVKNKTTQDMGTELESLSTGLSNALEVARSTSDELFILHQYKQHLSQQNAALSAQVASGVQGIRALQSDILALQHEKDRVNDQVLALKAQVAGNAEERDNLERQVEMLRQELQQATVRSTEETVRILNQQHEIRQLKQDIQARTDDLGIMVTQLEGMKHNFQRATTDAADMAEKMAEAKTESRLLSQKRATLSADVHMLSQQNATSQQMLVKVRGERMSLINHVARQCLEIQSIERELMDLKQSLERERDYFANELKQLARAKGEEERALTTQVNESQRHCAELQASLVTSQFEKEQAMHEVRLREFRMAQLSSALAKAESQLQSSQLHTEQLSQQLIMSREKIASEEHVAREMISEVEVLSTGLADALKVAQSSTDESQQLLQQRELLIRENQQVQTQNKLLGEELDAVRHQSASLQREIDHLVQTASEYQERLEIARKEAATNQDDKRQLQEGNEVLRLEKEAARKQVNALERDVSEYQKRLEVANTGMIKIQEERQQLQNENEVLELENETKRKQVGTLEQNMHALEMDISEYQERLTEARTEAADLRLEQQKLQEKHERLESENGANKTALRRNDEQVEQLRAERAKILLEQRELQHEKDALAIQNETTRKQMRTMEQGLSQGLKETVDCLAQARDEIAKLLAEKQQVREEKDALAHQNEKMRKQIMAMEEDSSAQTAKVEVLQLELSQMRTEVSEARLVASTSQSDLRDLRARTDKLVQEKHSMEREMISTKMERDLLAQELGVRTLDASGSNPFKQTTDENIQLENVSLVAACPRMKMLSSQLAQQRAVIRTEREKHFKMQAHLSEVQSKLEVSRNELRAAQSDLSTFHREKDHLLAEANGTQKQMHNLRVQLTAANTELAETLVAQEQTLALQPAIERLEDMLQGAFRRFQHWQQEVERLRQLQRSSNLSISEANAQYRLLEEDFLELQAKYYGMESRFEDSRIHLEILNNRVREISESHAAQEAALQLEVHDGKVAYEEICGTLKRQETELRSMAKRFALWTRALTKWLALVHHTKMCRRIAVRRAHVKKLYAAISVWRAWKMLYLQRRNMIERKDYWREKGSLAEIMRRQTLHRSVRTCFERFKGLCKGKKLLIQAVHFVKYVRERKSWRQLLQRWRAHVICQNFVGYVPRPSRLSEFQVFRNTDLRMSVMLSKQVHQRVAAYSSARRIRELSIVLESWAIVKKTSRVESAVAQRVVSRFNENQDRRCVKRTLVYWARLCFSPGTDCGCETMMWATLGAKRLRLQQAGSRLLIAVSLIGRCKHLKESLACHALRYGSERLVSFVFMAWALVAKTSSRELAIAEQTADHLSVKAKVVQLESAHAQLQNEVEQREHHVCLWEHRHEAAAELALRISNTHANAKIIFNCFMALRSVTRWQARCAAAVQRSHNERVVFLLLDVLQQWVRVAVSSQVRTCTESLEMERSSVNTLAQWHAAARHEQEACRASVHHIAAALFQLGHDCKHEFTALPLILSQLTEDHRSHLINYHEQLERVRLRFDARSDLLERWFETRQIKRAMQLGLIAWAQICKQSQQSKRVIMLQRSFNNWRQVSAGQKTAPTHVRTRTHQHTFARARTNTHSPRTRTHTHTRTNRA
jgi:chromosome segregation ATPase